MDNVGQGHRVSAVSPINRNQATEAEGVREENRHFDENDRPHPPPPPPPGGNDRPSHAGESGETDADGGLPPELIEVVYAELKDVARRYLGNQANSHTLQPTAIVHEAWLRMASNERLHCPSRGAFFALASTVIRRILIDHARKKHAQKRGGKRRRQPWNDALEAGVYSAQDLLEIDDELQLLESAHPVSAQIIEMRLYGGMDDAQIAERLGVSTRTVRSRARTARMFMRARLDERDESDDHPPAV